MADHGLRHGLVDAGGDHAGSRSEQKAPRRLKGSVRLRHHVQFSSGGQLRPPECPSTPGCIIFVELSPCVDCARAIIQAGLTEVVINHDRNAEYMSERYSGEHPTALEMLAEADVTVRFVSPRNIEDRVQDG